MDERRPPRKDDDVPIIGDYSQAADDKLFADAKARTGVHVRPDVELRGDPRLANEPRPASSVRTPSPARASGESWAVDPVDVRRYAQIKKQRDKPSPLGKIARYGILAVVLAAAVSVYLNFETLRGVTVDVSAITNLFAPKAETVAGHSVAPTADGEPATVNVAAPAVAGQEVPASVEPPPTVAVKAAETAVETRTPAPASAAAEAAPAPTEAAAAAAAESPAANDAAVASQAPPPLVEPDVPDGPETFEFGIPVITVSEADPSAAVIILRNGGRRRASSVTWWTKDGSATAGSDYADLGKVTVKFAAGEQNKTIRIPIVSDNKVEGPETFYVYLATDESAIAAGEPTEQVEVVINDRQ